MRIEAKKAATENRSYLIHLTPQLIHPGVRVACGLVRPWNQNNNNKLVGGVIGSKSSCLCVNILFVCKHEEIRTYKSLEIKLIDLWTTTSTSNYATLSSRRSRRDITQMDSNQKRWEGIYLWAAEETRSIITQMREFIFDITAQKDYHNYIIIIPSRRKK